MTDTTRPNSASAFTGVGAWILAKRKASLSQSVGLAEEEPKEWIPWEVYFSWLRRRAVTGELLLRGDVMRRRVNGRWQYRTPTDEDIARKLNEMACF